MKQVRRRLQRSRRGLLYAAGAAAVVLFITSAVMWAWVGRYSYGVALMRGRTMISVTTTSNLLVLNTFIASASFPNRADVFEGGYSLPLPPRTSTVVDEGRWQYGKFDTGASEAR